MHPPFDDLAWTALVADLDASARAERDDMVRELGAANAGELGLSERLASAIGGPISVRLASCPDIEGTLLRVGRDHLWVADAHGYWLLVTVEVDGLSWRRSATSTPDPQNSPSMAELRGLASALRELIRLGRQVSVLVGDRWLAGRLRLVGADFMEIDDVCLPLARVRACRVWY